MYKKSVRKTAILVLSMIKVVTFIVGILVLLISASCFGKNTVEIDPTVWKIFVGSLILLGSSLLNEMFTVMVLMKPNETISTIFTLDMYGTKSYSNLE